MGRPQPNPYKETKATGIGKQPQSGPVEVRAPGPKRGGLGSGVVGDFIGDVKHHGGRRPGRVRLPSVRIWIGGRTGSGASWPNGFFGENLTTVDLEVNEARIGERWQIGEEVVLQVTSARGFRARPSGVGWGRRAG